MNNVYLIVYHNPDEGDILFESIVYASRKLALAAIAEMAEELEGTLDDFSIRTAKLEE